MQALRSLSRYPMPEHIATEIEEYAGRFGSLTLTRGAPGAARPCGPRAELPGRRAGNAGDRRQERGTASSLNGSAPPSSPCPGRAWQL